MTCVRAATPIMLAASVLALLTGCARGGGVAAPPSAAGASSTAASVPASRAGVPSTGASDAPSRAAAASTRAAASTAPSASGSGAAVALTSSSLAPSASGQGGTQTVPLKIVHGPGGSVLALIPVTIQGQGPYAFALDTGASNSTIDAALAKKLQLPNLGSAGQITGVAATTQAQFSEIKDWKIGNVTLPADKVFSVDLGGQNSQAGLAGLVGSDILNTFGAATVDYEAEKLILRPHVKQQVSAAPSTPAPTKPGSAVGPPRPIPLKIVNGPSGSVLALAPVSIGGQGPFAFALDTGASNSTLDAKLAQKLGLPDLGVAGQVTGVAAMTQARFSQVKKWAVGDVELPAKKVITVDLGGQNAQAGLAGLLGSDILSDYGAVTVDYDAQVLILRPHVKPALTGSSSAQPSGSGA